MENSNVSIGSGRASARDFFLHLGAIVALYTVTVSFVNLVFKIVNKAFPEVTQNYYAWGAGSEISLPVATLIVFFPLLILLSIFVYKIYAANPDKKEMLVRKWLIYITLFIAGITLAVDLVTVLYKFLDGQDLTAAFWLKALAVLFVAGCIFTYYIQDIREKNSSRARRWWAIGTGVLVLIFIIMGFAVLGSPKTQRLIRYDNQKVSDLQNLQWQVVSYWQMKGAMPRSLSDITAAQPYNKIPKDPQTQSDYKYQLTGDMTFELCAVFNREATDLQYPGAEVAPIGAGRGKIDGLSNSNWNHGSGEQCFTRVIDPEIYPTQVKG